MVQVRHTEIREGNVRSKDAVDTFMIVQTQRSKKERNFHWIIKSISVNQSLEDYASYACLDKNLNLITYRGWF